MPRNTHFNHDRSTPPMSTSEPSSWNVALPLGFDWFLTSVALLRALLLTPLRLGAGLLRHLRPSRGAGFAALALFSLLWTPALLAAGKTSYLQVYITPGEPTYVDAVTAEVIVRDQNTGTGINEPGTVSVSVDGGPAKTATLVNSTGYVNLGQLSIASHSIAVTFPGSASYAPSSTSTSTTVADAHLTFVGTQGTTFFGDGAVLGVNGVAVDDANNLYIVSSSSNNVQKEDTFGNVTTLPFNGLSGPVGLTVDDSGNVFVADTNNNRIVELDTSGHQSVLAITGLTNPTYIIYSYNGGDLYIADPSNQRIVQFDPSTGTQKNAVTGLTALRGIGIDAEGFLLYADRFAGAAHVYDDGSLLPILSSVTDPEAIAGDYYGNIYVSDAGTNVTLQIDPLGNQTQVNTGGNPVSDMATDNFGRVYLALGARVDVVSPGSGRAPDGPVNQGNPGGNSFFYAIFQVPQAHPTFSATAAPAKIFNTPGTVSCSANAGGCSETFYFDPLWAGVNTGSLTATLGSTSYTAPLWGKGIGGAAAFSPGVSSQVSSGSTAIGGVALDLARNRYVTDTTKKTVIKVPPTGAPTTLAFTGLSAPTQVAVDSSGAVYVLDTGLGEVLRLDPNGTQSVSYDGGSESNPIISPVAFALDGDTNLVVAGPGEDIDVADKLAVMKKATNRRVKVRKAVAAPAGEGSYAVIHILRQDLPAFDLASNGYNGADYEVDNTLGPVAAVAVDAYGFIYALESSGNLWSYDTYATTTELATGLTGATSVAVDAGQTAYVAQSNKGNIAVIHSDKSTGTLALNGLYSAASVAIDSFGDLLVGDSADKQLLFLDRTQQNYIFGNVAVGSPQTLAGAVSNLGNQPFTFNGTLPADGTFAPATGSTECNPAASPATVLAPTANCDLSYVFTPPSVGPFTNSGNLSTNPNTLFASASLGGMHFSGTGVAATGVPVLSPTTMDFGNVPIGTVGANQTATLTNTGTTALFIGFNITGKNPGGFGYIDNNCGRSLAAGASCSVQLNCEPVIVETLTASLNASFGVPPAFPPQSIALTCNGVSSTPAPQAALTPATANFGSVNVGSVSASQIFTLANTGTASLPITSVTLTGTNESVFTIGSSNCGSALAASSSCSISITFKPTAAGSASASLSVVDSLGTQTSSLSGTGTTVATAPAATLTPPTLAFGTVTTGSSSTVQTATLSNTGNAALAITGITLTGTNASDFSSTTTCGASLAAGAKCTISVLYAPSVTGAETASLSVADNAAGSPQTSSLTGTGAAPVVAAADFAVTATPAMQTITGGMAAKYTVAVASVGGSFTEAVTLSASGLPAGATVSFTPPMVTPGSAGATSIMTVQTFTQTAELKRTGLPRWPFTAPVLAAVFFFIPIKRMRRWRGLLSLAFFGIVLAALSGCGGGFGRSTISQPTTSTITVTGTSGSVTHSATV